MMPVRIERKLECTQSDGDKRVIAESELASLSGPVVILGDPGLGKTVLTEAIGELPGMKYVRAGTFVRQSSSSLLSTEDECIVVDGIDEIASMLVGSAIDEVLTKLSAVGNPRFILSCRAADWKGSADKVKIQDDYGVEPWLLYLKPFTYEEAHSFLSREFPDIDATSILNQLRSQGIEDIYGNPLTLRLVGEVMREGGGIPVPRVELLERACLAMLKEENPRHHDRPHAYNSEDVLNAVGTICAAVILCGRIGVYTGAFGTTPSRFARSEDIAKLPFGGFQEYALQTRLFKAQGENGFTPIHRVIAEYLGAKWLVNCFNDGASEKRILGLLRRGERVPTSLRGLNAWMIHFSDRLATRCIVADPIAVLSSGVAEQLCLSKARVLLRTLKESLERDPRSVVGENWPQFPHRASGLMHMELRDDIRAFIEKPGQHLHLTVILLQSMAGTDLAKEFVSLQREIMLSRDRCYAERFSAAKAFNSAAIQDSWEAILRDLLEMKDPDSARLAYEILALVVKASAISIETASEVVVSQLAHADGYGSSYDPYYLIVYSRLFSDLDVSKLPRLLDTLASRARPLIEQIISAEHQPAGVKTLTNNQERHEQDMKIRDAKRFIADLIRRLTVRVLEADLEIVPARIWGWIDWLEENDGYDNDSKARLANLVCADRVLRMALIEHLLLTPGAENLQEAVFSICRVLFCLRPTGEDIAKLLKAWRARAGDDPLDPEKWRFFLQIGLTDAGSDQTVHDTALGVANGAPGLLSILAEVSCAAEKNKSERARNQARQKARLQQAFRSLRDYLGGYVVDFARGDFEALSTPADIYLGRSRYRAPTADFSEPPPYERLRVILGDALSEHAMQGFIAVLARDDLPKASEIAQFYCQNKRHRAEASMICGVAEIIRRGISVDAINCEVLTAVYTAWKRAPESNGVFQIDIGSALEAVLFSNEADWEAHFRMSIEPQLAHNIEDVYELRRLCSDSCLGSLGGRLAVEWLHKYTELSIETQKRLIDCMLRNTDRTVVLALAEQRLGSVNQGSNEWLLWLSVAFVADFDNQLEDLKGAATKYPGLLWFIRDRTTPASHNAENGGLSLATFSLDQLAFVVQSFAEHWPIVTRPSSCSGEGNPWDASDFVTNIVHTIARIPSPEASEVLRSLMSADLRSYTDTIERAVAFQLRNLRDAENRAPTVDELRAVVTNMPPETISDMRAWFADRIETLQEQMHGSNTDMWQAYWVNGQPRCENYCRNRLIEHISRNLPDSIQIEPEPEMPGGTRGDIALMRCTIKLPIEIKGQWHPKVWDAATDQLAAKYARDWQAKGCGAYIVLWFGDVPGKLLPRHPDGLEVPQTPEALREMLIQRLKEELRAGIDVYVIDISKPS